MTGPAKGRAAAPRAWDSLRGLPVVAYPFDAPCACHEASDPARLPAAPLVSIVVAVWNHEAYLGDALRGLFAQVADFPYEILLCEDCSSDGSRAICLDAQRRHPERVRVLFGERNLGGRLNFLHGIDEARGTYVALLEGDDFWTNPRKLSLQVEAMRREGARMCVAWNERLEERTGLRRRLSFPQKTALVRETYRGEYYHTSTYVLEKSLWREALPYFTFVPFFDSTLVVIALALAGRIAVAPEYVSVYRQTGRGAYTGKTGLEHARTSCLMYTRLRSFGPPGLETLVRKSCFDAHANVVISTLATGRWTWEATLAMALALWEMAPAMRFANSRFLVLRAAKAAVLLPWRALRRLGGKGGAS